MSVSEPVPATTTRYPLAHVTYDQREIRAVVQALNDGRTTCGPRVAAFEQTFARYVGRDHAIMVNSGSSADMLLAFGLPRAKPGDEILVPAVTWPTQVWACLLAGYRVRLVDVDLYTLQFDPEDLAAKINDRTRAIFPVHILGLAGDISTASELARARGIPILEDCCEALGTRWDGRHVGTFGQAAAFSFFFSHLITTMEGGMIVTDDAAMAHRYRLWRAHGWEPTPEQHFTFPQWGFNVRPTEPQGAFGSVQMERLAEFQAARERNVRRLLHGTVEMWPDALETVATFSQCTPSWHGFPLFVDGDGRVTRDGLCRYLNSRGVETRPIVAGNLARQAAVRNDPRVIAGPLPGADYVHTHGCYLGVASFDDGEGTDYVAEVVSDFMQEVL